MDNINLENKISSKKMKIILFFIFLLSFFVRMLFYYYTMNKTNFNGLTGGYIFQADSFLSGEHVFMSLSNGKWILETIHPKGYPFLIIISKLISSDNFMLIVHLIQAVVDSLVCILIYNLAKSVFDNKLIGILGAFLYAIYPSAIFNSLQELPDAFACFFLTLSLLIYYRQFHKAYLKYILIGVVAGVSMYFRSELTYVPFILIFCDLLGKPKVLNVFKNVLLVILPMLILQLPWSLYAYKVSGSFNTQASTMWGSMYESFGEDENNAWGIQVDDAWMEADAKSKGFEGGAWTTEANLYYKEECIRYIQTYPMEYMKLVANRLSEAFIPGSFTLFNLNRSYTNIVEDQKEMCSAMNGLSSSLCYKSNSFAINYEWYAKRYSKIVFLGMLIFILLNYRNIKKYLPLYLIWMYLPIGMSLIKRIEPRNVAANNGILILCFSFVLVKAIKKIYDFIQIKFTK